MAAAVLKRVVIDNYKIFQTKQLVDFTADESQPNNSKYFTLVGENGSGKSTFLALVGLASDFGGRISKRVCDSSRESIVACEYDVENWTKLSYHENNNFSHIYPALELWFLGGVLKIPPDLRQFFAAKHPGLDASQSIVVIGFKHVPNPGDKGEAIVSKFVYVQCGGQITALIQPFNRNAKMAKVGILEVDDLLQWTPDERLLISTQCNFLRLSTPLCEKENPFEGVSPKHPQAAVILGLRNTQLPVESRDVIWDDIIELFHQLTGDGKITVVYDSGSIHMRQQFGGCDSMRDDLPDGFFHAFIMAFLIECPQAKTILLDEPTRGMHPLQVRRLQRILTQKSLEKNKVIVVATHAPDMVHTSQISQIFRFQRLDSGYTEIRRVSSDHKYRDMRFISSVESRELFFTRRIIWVEGDTDQRFFEALLKLIDDGNRVLWQVLLDPRDRKDMVGYETTPGDFSTLEMDMDTDEGESSSMDEIDYGTTGINPFGNLFLSPAYEGKYFRANELKECQELARSCSVLPLSGKKNIDKATRICKDLGIPYAVVCDLDAILPNSKKNPIKKQFVKCAGNWNLVPVDRKLLFDGEQSPASACVDDPVLKAQLKQCRNAYDVMEFYESEERIFAWRVGNGEIEDLVRVSKSNFAKKRWADFTFDAFQKLIQDMLALNCVVSHVKNQSNPELLRCFYFILHFLLDAF